MTASAPKTQIIAIKGLNFLSSHVRKIDSFDTKDTVSCARLPRLPNFQTAAGAGMRLQVPQC